MQSKVIEFNNAQRKNVEAASMTLRSGDVVKVHRKIKEGSKERTQIFEGMIIAIKGGQSSSKMITVRKVSQGGYGVEIVVALNSPMIEKIELVKRAKVRRSKLYYIRDKAAKALRFKFTDSKDIAMPVFAEAAKEEEVAEEKTQAQQVAKEEMPVEAQKTDKEITEKAEETVEKTEEKKEESST